ncbi:hypothetical protein CCYA_CCYA03G1115 [Cyanidiococcus yangmingshanensis]|nr:hypothetical protein CCYA_CCYA03G1115 [Cyanidiococcus yangmingshanensis]
MATEEGASQVLSSKEPLAVVAPSELLAPLTPGVSEQQASTAEEPFFPASPAECAEEDKNEVDAAGEQSDDFLAARPVMESQSEKPSLPAAADELVERALDEDRSLASLLNADGPVRWPSAETLLHHVSCSLERRYLLYPGTMYITERYLCFKLSISHGPSFLEAAAAASASASSFLSFGYRSSPSTRIESAPVPNDEQRTSAVNEKEQFSSTRRGDMDASISPSINAHDVMASTSPPSRTGETGSATLWLVPFEAVTSVRKSSYLYLESALEVSTAFGLCNHTRYGGVFWTRPQSTPPAVKFLRFAAFSEPNRDAAYQYVMKAWMARLSLLALEGRLPLSIQDPGKQHPSAVSARPSGKSSSHTGIGAANGPEVPSDRTATSVDTPSPSGSAEMSRGSSRDWLKSMEPSPDIQVNGATPRESSAPVTVDIAYDIEAGQMFLEIPAFVWSAEQSTDAPEERVFEMFFADSSPLPRQLNEQLGHSELQMSTWQRLDATSDSTGGVAACVVPRYRTISYQVTVRRGLLSFTGHCTESQSFLRTPAALRDHAFPHSAMYEISVLTRDMPSSDTFLVRQRIFFDLSPDDKAWRVRVRAVLGIQWLARTVWRPFIERSVASQSRHAFEQMAKLMQSHIDTRWNRNDTTQLQERVRLLKGQPVFGIHWTRISSVLQSTCRGYGHAMENALGRLPPLLLYRLFLAQTVLLMTLSALCGYLLARTA